MHRDVGQTGTTIPHRENKMFQSEEEKDFNTEQSRLDYIKKSERRLLRTAVTILAISVTLVLLFLHYYTK